MMMVILPPPGHFGSAALASLASSAEVSTFSELALLTMSARSRAAQVKEALKTKTSDSARTIRVRFGIAGSCVADLNAQTPSCAIAEEVTQ
jgi:hypothetical protein